MKSWIPISGIVLFSSIGIFWLTKNHWGDLSQSSPPNYRPKHSPTDKGAQPQPALNLLMQEGKAIYAQTCQPCHGADGAGDEKNYPPLKNSPWVNNSSLQFSQIILRGLDGPIEWKNKTWGTQPMPPQRSFLSDRELAAVMTWVKNSFGNGGIISLPMAQKAREIANQSPHPIPTQDLPKISGEIPATKWDPETLLDAKTLIPQK